MLLRWYQVLFLGSLLINFTYGEDNEPEARVILTIETRPKSFFDARSSEESFVCYECNDCQEKFNQTIRICQPDVNMCFTTYKRIDNTNRIVRRGCSTSRGQCTVPDDHDKQLKSFDSVTCCIGPKCNQGIQTRSLVIVLMLNLSLMMMIYI